VNFCRAITYLTITALTFNQCISAQVGKDEELKVMPYPSLIYDSGKCSIYTNHLSKLMFMCFYKGKSKINDLGVTSKLLIDLPVNLKLKYSAIMNGWKKGGPVSDKFKTTPQTHDGMQYVRYTVDLPSEVFRPVINKPLPGGMFGGLSQNFTNIFVKPEGKVPDKFKIYWQVKGKYNTSGDFPAYMVKLPENLSAPKRIKLRSHGPLANLANPPQAIKDLAEIYRKVGIKWVDTQLKQGANKGYRAIWENSGFKFYGGSGFLHTLMKYTLTDRAASPNMNDYLVGLDGKRAYATDFRAYHGRIWCPKAVITPGRYPYELNIAVAKRESAQGATELDADFEVHGWSHCFCPECLKDFAVFANIPYSKLQKMRPVDIAKNYPMQWYRFRNEQTRKLYALLKGYLNKSFSGVKMGCNTIMQQIENNLGSLKYGICDFAEDPRLLDKSVDYFLADTLTGSVYDPISIDALRKTTTKPIISVAGCSYCVGFDPHCMAGRRMTAEMTGEKYGYGHRTNLLKLGMVHQAASGASGLRFALEEADAALKAAEAAAILAKVEDYYLDGTRADEKAEVIDLTQKASPWLKDSSRAGKIWRHFYNKYNGQVQYRVHAKDGNVLISLFNWDFHQDKSWLVRLPGDFAKKYYVTDIIKNKAICLDGKRQWSAAELQQGIPLTIPSAGMRIIKLTVSCPKTDGIENISSGSLSSALKLAKSRTPYDQYAWYKGKQIDMDKYVQKALTRPLYQIKKYGGKKKIKNLSGNAQIPFTSDFSKLQRGVLVWCSKTKQGNDTVLDSNKKYCFAGFDFRMPDKPLTLEVEFKSIKSGRLGAIAYEKGKDLKKISTLCWGKTAEDFQKMTFSLPVDKYNAKNCRVLFYNITHKGSILVREITLVEKPK
jgi:hypothetical protein